MQPLKRMALSLALSGIMLSGFVPESGAADAIKIGMLKVTNGGPIMIAQDKGYFAKEGLSAEIVPLPEQAEK